MSPDSAPDPKSKSAPPPPPASPGPPGQDELLRQELLQIYGRETRDPFTLDSLWGLALSGGGIRSATFALGTLQGLAHTGWLTSFHFVSSVSGGGYAASYLQALLHRNDPERAREMLAPSAPRSAPATKSPGATQGRPVAMPADREGRSGAAVITGATSPAILALRKFSNYLSPRNSALLGDRLGLVTSYLTNVVLVQLLLVPVLLALMLGASLAYLGLFLLWPWRWVVLGLMVLLAVLPSVGRRWGSAGGRLSRLAAPPWNAACAAVSLTFAAMLVWPGNYLSPALQVTTYAALMAAFALAYFTWTDVSNRAQERTSDRREWVALLAGLGVLAGAIHLLGLIPLVSMRYPFLFLALVLGAPLLAAACFLAGTITLGLSPVTSQMDRNRHEQWAAVSGQCGLFILAIVASLLLVTSPRPIERWLGRVESTMALPINWPLVFPIVGAIAAVIVVVAGAWVLRRDLADPILRNRKSFQLWRRALVVVAPTLLVAAILLGSSWTLSAILDGVGPEGQPAACRSDAYVWRCQSRLLQAIDGQGATVLAVSILAAFAIWYALAAKVRDNPNEFSMNSFYRNRLVRCYLAATNTGRGTALFDSTDDLKLSDLLRRPSRPEAQGTPPRSERPLYPLLCCAVNLTARKHLDWQDRKAASFVLSPLYCGHLTPRDLRVDVGDLRDAGGDAYDIGDVLKSIKQLKAEREERERQAARLQQEADRARAESTASAQHYGVPTPRKPAAPAAPASIDPARAWRPMPRDKLSPSPQAHTITLGTAMAISGAAVSPNMGYHSSSMVAFLMTLLNARLGASLRNSHATGTRGPALALLDELLGNTRGSAHSAYVSDGGHFENLGIYELVRRRCRFVLCIDASADPDRDFAGLGNAIHLCRVDFGAEIDVDVSRMRPDPKTGRSKQCATVGKIDYGDGHEGVLLYVKPCLLGDEPADITHYASEHPEFPHEPTSDQYFDERQFEAYRHLGFVTCLRVLVESTERAEADVTSSEKARQREQARSEGESGRRSDKPASVTAPADGGPRFASTGLNEHAKKSALLLELRHRFFEPSDAIALHFSRHGEAVNRIFQTLRTNKDLASLDPYLYPGWPRDATAVGTALTTPKPGTPQFRECFYFMQELIQLMESVYIDLQLENNYAHPDNRGWINIFRQWAWVPMFRLAWSLSAQTYGSRFVAFCETRLFVPDVLQSLRVSFSPESGTRYDAFAEVVAARRAANDINAVETRVLASPHLYQVPHEYWWLGVLMLDWSRVFPTEQVPGVAKSLGVGFVLLSGESRMPPTTIRVLRVQDHIRRLGLGTRFVREVATQFHKVEAVQIAPGDYAGIGTLSEGDATRQAKRLRRMLEEARRSVRSK